jgi:hypothetical protein
LFFPLRSHGHVRHVRIAESSAFTNRYPAKTFWMIIWMPHRYERTGPTAILSITRACGCAFLLALMLLLMSFTKEVPPTQAEVISTVATMSTMASDRPCREHSQTAQRNTCTVSIPASLPEGRDFLPARLAQPTRIVPPYDLEDGPQYRSTPPDRPPRLAA